MSKARIVIQVRADKPIIGDWLNSSDLVTSSPKDALQSKIDNVLAGREEVLIMKRDGMVLHIPRPFIMNNCIISIQTVEPLT